MTDALNFFSPELRHAIAQVKEARQIKSARIAEAIALWKQQRLEREFEGGRKRAKARIRNGAAQAPLFGVPYKRKRLVLSSAGLRSFHADYSSVTKSAASRGSGRGASYKGAAHAHSEYIEGEPTSPLVHTDYIDSSRVEIDLDGARLVRSNISNDPRERAEFFAKVELFERSNRGDVLEIDLMHDPVRCAALAADPACDPQVRKVYECWIRGELSQAKQVIRLEKPASELRPLMKKKGFGLAGNTNAARLKTNGFTIREGRGGRTQHRIVLEIPREFSGEQRIELLERLSARMEALGCMYVAVIHAPDRDNHPDNYHIHLDFYDRPCRRLDGTLGDLVNVGTQFRESIKREIEDGKFANAIGHWDFTVERRYAANKRYKTHRPFGASKVAGVRPRDFISTLRRDFANDVNEISQTAGGPALYNDQGYSQLGISSPISKKLGPALHKSEVRGEPTEIGVANETAQAEYDRSAIEAGHAERMSQLSAQQLTWEAIETPKGDTLVAAAKEIDEAIAQARQASEIRYQLDLLQLESERERSRAELVRDRQGSSMKSGSLDKQRKAAGLYAAASAHLELLDRHDEPLAKHRGALVDWLEVHKVIDISEKIDAYRAKAEELANARETIARSVEHEARLTQHSRSSVSHLPDHENSAKVLPVLLSSGPIVGSALNLNHKKNSAGDGVSPSITTKSNAGPAREPNSIDKLIRQADAMSHYGRSARASGNTEQAGPNLAPCVESERHSSRVTETALGSGASTDARYQSTHMIEASAHAPVAPSSALLASKLQLTNPQGADAQRPSKGNPEQGSTPPVSQSQLQEMEEFEKEMLLHIARTKRLDFAISEQKIVFSPAGVLLARYSRHAPMMVVQLQAIARENRRELDGLRRHLETGAPDTPYMAFLRGLRPDIVTDVKERGARSEARSLPSPGQSKAQTGVDSHHQHAAAAAASRFQGF